MGTFQTSDKRSAAIFRMIKATFVDREDFVRLGELLADNATDDLQYSLALITETSLKTLVSEIDKQSDKYLRYLNLYNCVKADNHKYAVEDAKRKAELKRKREEEEQRKQQIIANQDLINLIDDVDIINRK